ncbi:MAG TPA: hypothetical protein VF610_03890 [Segetibacter sp.]|jgi:hypothetical protein
MSLPAVFDKYFTKEDARFYYRLFLSNELHPVMDKPKETFDAIFGNSQMDLQYILRLPADDFARASAVLEQEIRKHELPDDYYLHEMDNQELYEILLTPKEWSRQDVIGAKILLESRNFLIGKDQLVRDKAAQKEKDKQKQKISLPLLILFYIISPVGAFLPVFTGIVIYILKDTDVDGNKDFVFSNNYRRHGVLLAVIGTLSSVGWYLLLRS